VARRRGKEIKTRQPTNAKVPFSKHGNNAISGTNVGRKKIHATDYIKLFKKNLI
jgi:hypothetical protein